MTLTVPATIESANRLTSILTIEHYFQTFNQGDFDATAQLFADEGALHPPFEMPIVGSSAIAAYLKKEADGMQAIPSEVTVTPLSSDRRQVVVKGSVKAIVFTVKAAWIFELDACDRICHVQVQLLASLQDLLAIRP